MMVEADRILARKKTASVDGLCQSIGNLRTSFRPATSCFNRLVGFVRAAFVDTRPQNGTCIRKPSVGLV
jgi:hypothetical protein